MLENGKKQNCPIDDEGLRFIMAREHRTQKTAPLPNRRTSKCEFFSRKYDGGGPRERTYASKIFGHVPGCKEEPGGWCCWQDG